MTQNFAKIFETLNFLMHGQAELYENLMLLVNNGIPMQEARAEMDPDGFYNEPQHPVEIELPPTPTTPGSSSPIESEATSTNGKHPPVKCADCGKIFIRNSPTGSISHHATNSLCRPFQCSVCNRRFKKVRDLIVCLKPELNISILQTYQRNQHEKTHVFKRTATANDNDEPDMKRLRQEDTAPGLKSTPLSNNQAPKPIIPSQETSLKNAAFKNNQILESTGNDAPEKLVYVDAAKTSVNAESRVAEKKRTKNIFKTTLTFLDGSSDDEN
jgi:hypothetical protein